MFCGWMAGVFFLTFHFQFNPLLVFLCFLSNPQPGLIGVSGHCAMCPVVMVTSIAPGCALMALSAQETMWKLFPASVPCAHLQVRFIATPPPPPPPSVLFTSTFIPLLLLRFLLLLILFPTSEFPSSTPYSLLSPPLPLLLPLPSLGLKLALLLIRFVFLFLFCVHTSIRHNCVYEAILTLYLGLGVYDLFIYNLTCI